ncbi:MAG TPA: radical SAM protein [bacterium]|nr:radical SAM protein [bacterium]
MNSREKFYGSLEKGKRLFSEKRYEEALNEYLKLYEGNSASGSLLLEMGKTFFASGNYTEALRYLKKASGTGDDEGAAGMLEAKILWMQGEREKAVHVLEEVIRRFPENQGAALDLGLFYEMTGKYGKAVSLLGRAAENFPGDGMLHFRIARLCGEIGEKEKAFSYFSRASALLPFKDDPYFGNLLLNEKEIAGGKRILQSKPMVLGMTLTHRCNLRCKMCEFYWNAGSYEIPETVFREVMELLPFLRSAYWQGGEPFLYSRFRELFEAASRQKRLKQIIVTNGLLIDEFWARRLAESRVDVICSIDGVDREKYEEIRIGGEFERLLSSLEKLNGYRKNSGTGEGTPSRLIMQTVVLKSNYRDLEAFLDFAREKGFDSLNFIPTRYTTDEENIFFTGDKEALQTIAEKMPHLEKKAADCGLKLFNQLPGLSEKNGSMPSPCAKESASPVEDTSSSASALLCHWPWKSLYALNEGKVKPYGFCEKEVGKITEDSLMGIWNNKRMQEYRDKLLSGSVEDFCSTRCVSGVIPPDCLRMER